MQSQGRQVIRKEGVPSTAVESDASSQTAAMLISWGISCEQNLSAMLIGSWEMHLIVTVAATVRADALRPGNRPSKSIMSSPLLDVGCKS